MPTHTVRVCLAFLVCLAFNAGGDSPLYAQGTGRVIGRVVEAEKGAPVAGAQIEVVEGGRFGRCPRSTGATP